MSESVPAAFPQMRIAPIAHRYECDELGIERIRVAPSAEVNADSALCRIVVQSGVLSGVDELAVRWRIPASYETAPLDLWSLPNGCLEPRMCVALKNGRYVPDTLRGVKQAIENGYSQIDDRSFLIPRRRVRRVEGSALLVGSPVGGNYFHWLSEVVPRWLLVRDFIDVDTRILVHELGAMERSALEAAGVPRELILVLPEDENLQVERLLVGPCGVQGGARIVPAAVEALRSLVTDSSDAGERIYISRRDALRRRVANEAEVLAVLRRHRFREVQPGKLSVRDQVDQFSKAAVILGMHGAGLVNAVFAPAGAAVIELQPSGLDSSRIALYWRLSGVLGHRYVQVVCGGTGEQAGMRVPDRDIVVDVPQLDRALTELLNGYGGVLRRKDAAPA